MTGKFVYITCVLSIYIHHLVEQNCIWAYRLVLKVGYSGGWIRRYQSTRSLSLKSFLSVLNLLLNKFILRLLLCLHFDELGIYLVCVGCLRFTVGILGVLGHVDDVRGFVLDLRWREDIYIHNLRWLLVASLLCILVIIYSCWSRNYFWNILRLTASAAAFSDRIRILKATEDGESDEKDAEYASHDIQPY